MTAFHYAFKVKDIESTRAFYIELLGCQEGRSTSSWIDFSFFGHQLSAHVSDHIPALDYCGVVDAVKVPIPHFGCLLDKDLFEHVESQLIAANIDFIIKPQTRYKGKAGEQRTMFVLDFSNNAIEFKCFSRNLEIFI